MTPSDLWDRVLEAADVIPRWQASRPQRFKTVWPEPPSTEKDAWERSLAALRGENDGDPIGLYRHDYPVRLGSPDRSATDRAVETLWWVQKYTRPKERIAIWALAFRLPRGGRGAAARHLRCSRSTLIRWRNNGLTRICESLVERRVA